MNILNSLRLTKHILILVLSYALVLPGLVATQTGCPNNETNQSRIDRVINILSGSSKLVKSFKLSEAGEKIAYELFDTGIAIAKDLRDGKITLKEASDQLDRLASGELIKGTSAKFQERFQQIVAVVQVILAAFSPSTAGDAPRGGARPVDVDEEIKTLERLMKP